MPATDPDGYLTDRKLPAISAMALLILPALLAGEADADGFQSPRADPNVGRLVSTRSRYASGSAGA
jgi:hypothetical protein